MLKQFQTKKQKYINFQCDSVNLAKDQYHTAVLVSCLTNIIIYQHAKIELLAVIPANKLLQRGKGY